MEAAGEHDDVRAAGHLLGQLHRRLGRLRAGVGEEERVDAGRAYLGQPGAERFQQVVAIAVHLGVDEALGLRLDGGHDLGMAVPGDVTAMPLVKSRYSVPSVVVTTSPVRHDLQVGDRNQTGARCEAMAGAYAAVRTVVAGPSTAH